MSHFGAIWEPFWVHFGTPEPFWVHFGAHLGLQEHIWAADPILGPILEPFWDHFWVQFGPKKQPKNKSKFKTLSDTILGPILDPLWCQKSIHLNALGICVASPGAGRRARLHILVAAASECKPCEVSLCELMPFII